MLSSYLSPNPAFFEQILYWDMPYEEVIKVHYFVLCTKQPLGTAREK